MPSFISSDFFSLDWTAWNLETVLSLFNASWPNAGWQSPQYLLLLVLAIVPLIIKQQNHFQHPVFAQLKQDPLSLWLTKLWRLWGVCAIAGIAIALAGPYWGEQAVEKTGRGAHVMLVLDRSASMNDAFADANKNTHVSKIQVARQLLQGFVKQGNDDLVGMVTFSTSPILVAPLGRDREAVKAALQATEAGGMGFTAVARGLGMALDYFEDKPVTGARAIVLVSDGGAYLDVRTQDLIRNMFRRYQASLYWIYLRSANGASLNDIPSIDNSSAGAYPEYDLHEYFKSLKVPYHAYEAENPQALGHALADIAKLKNQPTRYLETVSRQDLSWIFYLIASLSSLLLLMLHLCEIKQWRTP